MNICLYEYINIFIYIYIHIYLYTYTYIHTGSKYLPESRYPVIEPKNNFWTLFSLPDGKELR
jgi:hypothetical protein